MMSIDVIVEFYLLHKSRIGKPNTCTGLTISGAMHLL